MKFTKLTKNMRLASLNAVPKEIRFHKTITNSRIRCLTNPFITDAAKSISINAIYDSNLEANKFDDELSQINFGHEIRAWDGREVDDAAKSEFRLRGDNTRLKTRQRTKHQTAVEEGEEELVVLGAGGEGIKVNKAGKKRCLAHNPGAGKDSEACNECERIKSKFVFSEPALSNDISKSDENRSVEDELAEAVVVKATATKVVAVAVAGAIDIEQHQAVEIELKNDNGNEADKGKGEGNGEGKGKGKGKVKIQNCEVVVGDEACNWVTLNAKDLRRIEAIQMKQQPTLIARRSNRSRNCNTDAPENDNNWHRQLDSDSDTNSDEKPSKVSPHPQSQPPSISTSTFSKHQYKCEICTLATVASSVAHPVMICDWCENEFHMKCLNLKSRPLQKEWYCKSCSNVKCEICLQQVRCEPRAKRAASEAS